MEHTVKQDPHRLHPGYSTTDERKPQPQQQQHTYRPSVPRLADGQGSRHTQQPAAAAAAPFIGSLALLERILTAHHHYDQRTKYAQQLDKFISDSCSSGVIQWHRQDMMQIVEICTHYSEPALSNLLSQPDVPFSMKQCLCRILATAACYTRLDLLMGWLLDRLIRPSPGTTATTTTTTTDSHTEYKSWLLSILQEAIVRAQMDTFTQRQLQEAAPSIMANLMLFLDSNEAVQQLEKVLMILSSLAEYYHTAFAAHFQSLVDLLVGWCLTAETSDQHCDMISNALVGFGSYWNTNIVFGFELLQHFINDLYAQIQEMQAQEDDDAEDVGELTMEEHAISCHRLLSCFYCLSQAVIPLIPSLDQYHQINTLFYQLRSDAIMLFLQALGVKSLTNPSWFEQCNQIMLLMSFVHPITFQPLQHSMYYYFTTQFEQSHMPPLTYIGYLLKMIHQSKPAAINQETVHELVDVTRSPLFPLLDGSSQQQQQGVLLIFYHIFSTSPAAAAAFLRTYSIQWTTILQRKIPVFKTPRTHSQQPFPDTAMPRMSDMMHHEEEEEEEEKCDNNNNIDDRIELEPRIYCRLLLKTATAVRLNTKDDDDNEIPERHEYQTARTLYECWRHGDYDAFDSILTLLIHYWQRQSSSGTISTVQDALLHDLTLPVNWARLSYQSKLALLDHLSKSSTIPLVIAHLIESEAYEINPSIKEKIIRLATSTSTTTDAFFQSSTNNSSSPIVRTATRDFIQSFDPLVMLSTAPTLYWEKKSPMPLLKAMMMSTPHTGVFRPIHYELVMKKLGMQHLLVGNSIDEVEEEQEEEDTWDWARRLFYTCGGTLTLENVDLYRQQIDLDQRKITTLINGSRSLLYYWVLWECSRYCILSRLRTPFGGPQQTFAAFEKSLSALVNNDTTTNTSQLYGLLMLLDRLEIQMYNAAQGKSTSTSLIPVVPQGNFTFFHTNRKTCQDYYLRMRPLMIQGAKKLTWDTFFLKHAMLFLSEQQSLLLGSDMETCLTLFKKINLHVKDIVDTCIHHGMVDTITGLETWYQQVVRDAQKAVPSFMKEWYFDGWIGPLRISSTTTTATTTSMTSWFKIAIDFAKGHDENAITAMSQFDHLFIGTTNNDISFAQEILDMLNTHMLHFYTSLEDYDAIRLVCQRFPYLFSTEISKQLVNFATPSSIAGTTTNTTTWTSSVIDDLKKKNHRLDSLVQLGRLTAFRRSMFDTSTNQTFSNLICQRVSPACLEYDDQPLDSLVFTDHRANLIELQLQHRLFIGTKNTIDHPFGQDDDNNTTTKIWARLANTIPTTDNDNLYLKTAKVAKQQSNYRTASHYLEKCLTITTTTVQQEAMYEKIKLDLVMRNVSWQESFLAFNAMLTSTDQQQLLNTKLLLKMAQLLEDHPTNNSVVLNDPNISSWLLTNNNNNNNNAAAISTLIKKATEGTVDTYTKPWFIYGEHHYQQAYQLLDSSKEKDMYCAIWHPILATHGVVNQEHLAEIEKFLWHLFQTYSPTTPCLFDVLLEKLQQHAILGSRLPRDAQIDLLRPLLDHQASLLTHFRTALTGFFRYLDLTDTTMVSSKVISASLYLVQILVHFGDALQPDFEQQQQQQQRQPSTCWKHIMPQLFSRLASSKSKFVKKILGQWIGQLVDTSPHQVIYPIMVGLQKKDEKTEAEIETLHVLHAQADRIKAQSDHVWTATRRMTEALQRLTVLWEEQWLHRISILQLDVMYQWERIDERPWSLEMYQTSMQPIIRSLEELISTTIQSSPSPENGMTPHEQWFDTTFGTSIRRAFTLVATPESLETYRKGWDRFQQIHRRLMMETQKCRVFELNHISPYLAGLQETSILMPGLSTTTTTTTIHHFGSTLTIIPTKTKPKKMDMHGSDGNTYTFLFKGMEDLRLDERIMQLLETTNVLLNEQDTTTTNKRHLQARTYAVIPMSDHSGMLQWVQHATPLFAFYKNWQKRNTTAMLQQQRPTEHYTEKVLTKMKHTPGLRVTTNRRHWPAAIVRAVYHELVDETPQDLLSKALWWSSIDPQDYLIKQDRFAKSMAVMSMMGYILGLGDRHLDNMLMDNTTGDIIHIDYNVCFEKGITLRVPERVPYRLTRNMVHALGIAGIHGQFGAAAEHTLQVLKDHKSLLLGLLDDDNDNDDLDKADVSSSSSSTTTTAVTTAKKEEQQQLGLQESLTSMATKLGETSVLREKQHVEILDDLTMTKQSLQQLEQRHHDTVQEEEDADIYDEEEEEDDDDDDDDEDNMTQPATSTTKTSPPSDWEELDHVPSILQSQLATKLTHLIQHQLNPPRDMVPLLESIRMLELEENNEIHGAQQSAKMILDTLQWLDTCNTKLCDQGPLTFTLLIEMVQEIMDQLNQYYASLRMLESFGGTVGETPRNVSRKQQQQQGHGIKWRVRQKLEGKDQDYVTNVDEIMTVADQVAKTIEQATSVDNLCLMYEGWTSWI